MNSICMENCKIRVCLHPTTGGLLAIMDMARNISYEFVSSGFSLTADGTQYFVDAQAVSFEKTDTGVRVLFKDLLILPKKPEYFFVTSNILFIPLCKLLAKTLYAL